MRKVTLLASLLALAAACSSNDDDTTPTCPPDNRECRAASTASAGKLVIERRRCEQCHTGPSGTLAGQSTPLAGHPEGIELYPPNLTPHATGIAGWTDEQLANAIRTGVDRQTLALCPQMKHDDTMTDFEVFSVIKYLRQLDPVEHTIPRSVCPPLKSKDEQHLGR